jgi:uncharacterized Zn finger protein (UPF0148 family)
MLCDHCHRDAAASTDPWTGEALCPRCLERKDVEAAEAVEQRRVLLRLAHRVAERQA